MRICTFEGRIYTIIVAKDLMLIWTLWTITIFDLAAHPQNLILWVQMRIMIALYERCFV